jgi:ribonuclease G
MEKDSHREKVLDALEEELRRDRAKTNIVSMSELGLVEMTRKRIRPSLIKSLCEPCSYCDGKGYIKRKSTVSQEIFRELERDGNQMENKNSSIVVHCHGHVVDWIYEMEGDGLAFIEKKLGRSITFKVEPNYHHEQYEIFFL